MSGGKFYPERGPTLRGFSNLNAAFVQQHDFFHDGKSKSSSTGLAVSRVICSVEAFKDLVSKLLWDTLAVVNYLDDYLILSFLTNTNFNRRLVGAKALGVLN